MTQKNHKLDRILAILSATACMSLFFLGMLLLSNGEKGAIVLFVFIACCISGALAVILHEESNK